MSNILLKDIRKAIEDTATDLDIVLNDISSFTKGSSNVANSVFAIKKDLIDDLRNYEQRKTFTSQT